MVDEAIVIKEQLLSAGKELVLELKMREYANEPGEVVVKRQFQDQDFPRADHRLEDPMLSSISLQHLRSQISLIG